MSASDTLRYELMEHRVNVVMLRAKIFETKLHLYALHRAYVREANAEMTHSMLVFFEEIKRIEALLDRNTLLNCFP